MSAHAHEQNPSGMLTPEEINSYQMHNINFGNMLFNIDKNRSGLDKQKIGLIFNDQDLTLREVL